jgi:dolichyl-phosphate-mannose--protein O-mannosyl transferase
MGWGLAGLVLILGAWGAAMVRWPEYSGKFVTATFVLGAIVLFIYFFPVWTAMPIDREGYYARMWLSGPGIRNWI